MQASEIKCAECGIAGLFALKEDWMGDVFYCTQCGTLNMDDNDFITPKYYQYFTQLQLLVDKPNLNKSCIDAILTFTK